MSSGVALFLCAALVAQSAIVSAEDDDGEDIKPYKLMAVIDAEPSGVAATDWQTAVLEYLNTTIAQVGNNLIAYESVAIGTAATIKLCDSVIMEGVTFLISLVRDPAAQKRVKDAAKMSHIPTIQINFDKFNYNKNGQNSTDSTNPNMTMWEPMEDVMMTDSNYIEMYQPRAVFYNVFNDLAIYLNITDKFDPPDTVVLFDDNFQDDLQWQELMKDSGVTLTFEPMQTNMTEAKSQLAKLGAQPSNVKKIVLVGSVLNIANFLEAAQPEFAKSSPFFESIFVVSIDRDSYACEQCAVIDNLFWAKPDKSGALKRLSDYKDWLRTFMDMAELVTPVNEVTVSFFLDLSYMINEFIMKTNSTSDVYPVYTCNNATLGGSNKTVTLTEYMPMFDTGVYGQYQAFADGVYFQDITTQIVKVFANNEGTRITKEMGNWTVTEGVKFDYALDTNLEEIKNYKVAIVVQPPFIEKCDPSNPNHDCSQWTYRGYCMELIDKIKDSVGFTYTVYEVRDKMYGNINEQGEWNGLIGDLISGAADIALAPLSVMAERENFVDFTVPYYDLVGTTILMKKQEVQYDLFKFMTVLEPPVWGCIVGAYFFTSFLLWIFDKFSPYSYTNNKEKYHEDPEKREFTLKECLWFCMTSLTPQGGGEAPKNISGRLVAATWWLFGFIIIASYTANLAAFLTVSRLETPIASLDDLSKQYKIKYAPVKGTASETYFKRMAEIEERFYDIWKAMSLNESMTPQQRAQLAVWDYPVSDKFTNMWRYMQEAGLPNTTEDAIDRVLESKSATEGFAFIGDATEIRYAELTNCKLQQVGNEFSRKPYAIAVQQGSPLKDLISSAILKLLNQRDLEHLKEQWWNQNPNKKNCPKMEDESDGISIQNIGGVFIVILVGIALSIVTLAFEYWYYKDRPRKDDETQQTTTQVNGRVNNGSIMYPNGGNNNELKEINANGLVGVNQIDSARYNPAFENRE